MGNLFACLSNSDISNIAIKREIIEKGAKMM